MMAAPTSAMSALTPTRAPDQSGISGFEPIIDCVEASMKKLRCSGGTGGRSHEADWVGRRRGIDG